MLCDVSTLFYFASFVALSLALILAMGRLSMRRQSRGSRSSRLRLSSQTPLLGRRPMVDEEQGLTAPIGNQDGDNDSMYSAYGTFEDFSKSCLISDPLFTPPVSSPTPKPLLPWRSQTLPSMPESFAATYELIKTFPNISMAPVHLVRQRISGEQLIIKQLQSRLIVDNERWPAEAHIVAKVLGNHKNVMGIKDIHTVEDNIHVPYANVVMEYASGGDLYDIIDNCIARKEKVPAQLILHFASSMIDALAFIHHGHASYDPQTGRPIVVDQPVILHCDIKPDNIFLNICKNSPYGLPEIRIADFGLAGAEGIKGIRGTKPYFPPELLEADIRATEEDGYWEEAARTSFCSKQSDMYSFAATLYELIALQRYRPGDDIAAAFFASSVVEHADILFMLQSGLAYFAEDRELAESWHHVSSAFKQKLQVWHAAGGRMPSWVLSSGNR